MISRDRDFNGSERLEHDPEKLQSVSGQDHASEQMPRAKSRFNMKPFHRIERIIVGTDARRKSAEGTGGCGRNESARIKGSFIRKGQPIGGGGDVGPKTEVWILLTR